MDEGRVVSDATDEQYFRGLMQDLLNAVVIQVAEDYISIPGVYHLHRRELSSTGKFIRIYKKL